MKEAIGHAPIYSFIALFIVITFGFLSATLMYFKAFKVNSNIAYALEEFEGYNGESEKEIERVLSVLGYRVGDDKDCGDKTGMNPVSTPGLNYPVCIYESTNSSGKSSGYYFNYGITTYIYLDIPVIGGTFKIPVYTESERIYKFSS